MNYLLKFSSFALMAFVLLSMVTSCADSDEAVLINSEEFVGGSIDSLESQGKIGRGGCYEFIFPVSIIFEDGTSAEAPSYDSLRATIKAWKENNPDAETKPTLSFPLEVMAEDGNIISVADQAELKELKKECRRSNYRNSRRARKFFLAACFDVVFPLTVEFPNGSIMEVASSDALKTAIRTWKETVERPIEDRPSVQFPITVEYEDGTQVEADSKEALIALKDECADSEG